MHGANLEHRLWCPEECGSVPVATISCVNTEFWTLEFCEKATGYDGGSRGHATTPWLCVLCGTRNAEVLRRCMRCDASRGEGGPDEA